MSTMSMPSSFFMILSMSETQYYFSLQGHLKAKQKDSFFLINSHARKTGKCKLKELNDRLFYCLVRWVAFCVNSLNAITFLHKKDKYLYNDSVSLEYYFYIRSNTLLSISYTSYQVRHSPNVLYFRLHNIHSQKRRGTYFWN